MRLIKVNKAQAAESIKRCAETEDGKILLAVLQKECGFMSNVMSMDDPNKTQVFAAQRSIWAKLRNYINPESLIDIEYRIQITDQKEGN